MIFYLIVLPIIMGLILFIIPPKAKGLIKVLGIMSALLIFTLTLYLCLSSFHLNLFPLPFLEEADILLSHPALAGLFSRGTDPLPRMILSVIGLFGLLISLYTVKYDLGGKYKSFYLSLLWSLGGACGVVLSNNLIPLLTFWGFLGLTLYLLINTGGSQAGNAAKKTMAIIGATDCLMILGIAIIYVLKRTFTMDGLPIELDNGPAVTAFLCLAAAAFAKAGAMPFHTWIPDCAEKAPVPVTAFLPASLDKLLGIYLLAKICLELFVMNPFTTMLLLIIGAVSLVGGVVLALVQHDYRKLLGYHAVSQVGYMVIGIGTGNPIGIAGGLFHMLNNVLYKSALFMGGGAVEQKTGTADIGKLGGYVKIMPFTFITFLIAALSISGMPPLNGFVSKWMIYQGIVELGKSGSGHWIIWLAAAMFGSALTLASFMKLIHAIFLGEGKKAVTTAKSGDAHWTMLLPQAVPAVICILFGVFAFALPLKFLIPNVPVLPGIWQPATASLLLVIGLAVGFIIYLLGRIKTRKDEPFTCGEVLDPEERVTGVNFYQTIKELALFRLFYKWVKAKVFDIYDLFKGLVLYLSKILQDIHTGILNTYICWILVGTITLLLVVLVL